MTAMIAPSPQPRSVAVTSLSLANFWQPALGSARQLSVIAGTVVLREEWRSASLREAGSCFGPVAPRKIALRLSCLSRVRAFLPGPALLLDICGFARIIVQPAPTAWTRSRYIWATFIAWNKRQNLYVCKVQRWLVSPVAARRLDGLFPLKKARRCDRARFDLIATCQRSEPEPG
jgi:hypothetical protein